MSEDQNRRRGPVLIELDAPEKPATGSGPRHESRGDGPSPADAPPIDEASLTLPRPRTMEMVTRLVGRPPSALTRFFINSSVALFTFLLSIAALDFINRLLDSYPVLGWIGIALFAMFTLAALGMAWREYRAWARFARIDAIQRQAGAALADDSMDKARQATDQLLALYRKRPELEWNLKRLAEARSDVFDARSLLTLAETELLAALDQEARREIEAASRTVAAATALIPLALADVAAALAANLRMIRRMAEIYGGRGLASGAHRDDPSGRHRRGRGGRRPVSHGRRRRRSGKAVAPLWRGRGERGADRAGRHRRDGGLPPPALHGTASPKGRQSGHARPARAVRL